MASRIRTQFPCSPLAFAVSIEDDANAPTYPAGCRVVIDPKRKPQPGSMVLALGADDQPVFGEYRPEQTAEGELAHVAPLNGASRAGARVIGTMTEYTVRASV